MTFQDPSVCFFHTITSRPVSVFALSGPGELAQQGRTEHPGHLGYRRGSRSLEALVGG
jgi:hypothetical protein